MWRVLSRCVLFVVALLIPAGAFARWNGPEDNRAESELRRMSLEELFQEGFDVCVRRATLLAAVRQGDPPDPATSAAGDYLSILEGFARDRNKGRLPEWMRAFSFARTMEDCQAVFSGFTAGETVPETKPAQAHPATPSPRLPVARRTPVPPRRATAPPVWRSPSPRPTATRVPTRAPAARRMEATPDVTDELPPWLRPSRR